MALDKELYRQVLAAYRQWNDAETIARAQEAQRLTPAQAWQQLVDLVEFCWQFSPAPHELLRQEEMEAIDRYYARVRRLETWRQAHGKTS